MHADISLTLMKRNLLVSIKIRRQPPQTPLLKDVLMFDSLWEHSAAVLSYMAVGFGAQMVDGALGMAFGVISNTLLLTLGVPPAAASAGVHTVEAFTTGISGISHVLHRNVDWKMFARLLIPGLIGGIAGAYLLSNIDGSVIKPFVLAYLISIGLWLIWRGLMFPPLHRRPKLVEPLGLVGGFLYASGGGGWGQIVRSEEHTSELQSLIRNSYDVFCLHNKKSALPHDHL